MAKQSIQNRSREQVNEMLCSLNTPIHRLGYYQLLIGIPYYAQNPTQSVTKELYPYVAEVCGCNNPRAVEHSIRELIHFAWNHRNMEVWDQYFHGAVKAPSNKQFIAVLASKLKYHP